MPLLGKIVVIKRNGTDGTHFPLTVNSCTFGRKKECDIRIQLPQVSKEHCKIEVNENKEAVLINLSTVNPTQLNGKNFQQPIYLKHGDILTIIDRSFRFEYPPVPLTRKRISRSEEKETLQVLHVQQVEQEKHPLTSECKSLPTSDEKFKWEGQKTNGRDEQSTQDTTIQNNSTCKIRRSGRKSMSPFGTLYEFMKQKADTKLTDENFSNKISIQQKEEYLPRKESTDIAASQTPRRVSTSGQTIQTEETETSILENFEQSMDNKNQGINMIVSNAMFAEGNCSRRSYRGLQIYAANERQDREEIKLLHFQNVKENKDSEVIKSSDHDACRRNSCSTVALECTEKAICSERLISLPKEVKTNLNTSGSVESVLTWSKAGGQSPETCSSPSSRQASGMLQTESDPLLGLKRTVGISIETEDIMPVMTREEESGILIENKYLNTNRNNKLSDTEQPLDAQIMEETKSDSQQGGHFETVAYLVNHDDNKSPRRSSRQRRKFSNAGSIIMEESLGTAENVSPFKGDPEENLMKYWPQKNDGYTQERPTTKSLEKSFVMKNIVGSSCLSKSCVQMPAEDVAQEKNMSDQFNIKKEPAVQRSPQKRKGGELDLSVQPLGKRKRVSFGGHLSPELFDKRLPPNSPLKRGAIPARFSLPFGNSPRAVLKKASGCKQCVIKGFFGKEQQDNILSSMGSPAASSTACRSPSVFSCNLPHVRGRFSVTRVDAPSLSSAEENVPEREMVVNKEVAKPETSHQESQTTQSGRRSNKFVSRRTSLHRRSAIRAKKQSGASEANLIVSRSWAEVVKQGVPKSQGTALKRRPAKKMPKKAPKSDASLKTPTRKVKGYFTTGHANSPAPIVVGKAHTSIVKITAQVPKVMFNYTLKQQQDANESFTGLTEMFHSPLNWKQGNSVSTVQKYNPSTLKEVSEIHTPEESGKINLSIQQIYDNQNAASPILRKVSQISTVGQHELKVSSGRNSALVENVGENSSLGTDETVEVEEIKDPKNETHSGTRRLMRNPMQEPELNETLSGIKRVLRTPKKETELFDELSGAKRLLRTPKQKPEPVEALSGVKRLLRTPKQKPEPVNSLSGVKRLFRTPKQKPEPFEALSGVKMLLRTPRQKPEPVEALSGVKMLLRTPKQDSVLVEELSGAKRSLRTPKQMLEPVDALSGVKMLLRTPRQKPEPVEALSGVKMLLRTPKQDSVLVEELSGAKRSLRTPKQMLEPVDALSGVKMLLRTPRQKPEPVEALSGVKMLLRTPKQDSVLVEELSGAKRSLRTPKQKLEPVDALSGVKMLLRTPRQKPEPVEALSGVKMLLRTPKQDSVLVEELSGAKRSLRTPKQKLEPVDALSGVKMLLRTPKQDSVLVEELSGAKRSLRTPKQDSVLVEELSGAKRSLRTPKQKLEPVDALSGVKMLLRTPRQKPEPVEALSGVKMLLRTPKQDSVLVEELPGAKRSLRTPKQELEPVDALSGVKRLLRTPKQKPEPVEALSGVKRLLKTPKQKPEPFDALSGVKGLLRTPKQEPEPVEQLSGAKSPLKTPEQNPEPVEALSGVKRLLRTAKQEPELVEQLSGAKSPLKTPKQNPEPVKALSGLKRLLRTPEQKPEPVDDTYSKVLNSPEVFSGLNNVTEEQKEKIELMEDMEGIQRLFRTPKQKFKPVEDMTGISRILETPKQKCMPVDDYLGLQKLMAEPKQNSLNAEVDYTGVKELLEPVDEYMVKLAESVNKPHEISSSEFGCKDNDSEREEFWQETGLEDSFGGRNPNAVPRTADDGHDELQDYLAHTSCSSLNDVKGEHVESIVTAQIVPEEFKSDGMVFQSGAVIDLIEQSFAKQGDPEERDAEISETLASVKKPRKGKASESSFMEEHDTTKTLRHTGNSSRAKLAKCMQTNENFDQNVPETSQPKESESNPAALDNEATERLREKSIETNGNMDSGNIRQVQELLGLSKEISVETQLSDNRKVEATLNRQAEESLHLEENAAYQEDADKFISKTYLRSRNQKIKNESESEFTKTVPEEKMQSSNLKTLKKPGNQVLKKNTRKRNATSVEREIEAVDDEKYISKISLRSRNKKNNEPKPEFAKINPEENLQISDFKTSKNTRRRKDTSVETKIEAVYGEKCMSPKICKLEILENHPAEMKEDAVRGTKRGKVHFLLDEGTPETLEEKYMFDGKGRTHQEQYNVFSERSSSPIKENTSKTTKQNNKNKAVPVVSPSLCISSEKQALAEISKDRENFTLAIKDAASFAQGECLQEINCDKNETQIVPWENMQTSVEDSVPKRQKVAVAKKNPPRRGRSRAASPEPPTKNGSKVTFTIEKQPRSIENTIFSKENQPKKGRGRKVASVSPTLAVPKEDLSTVSSGFAQGECLQGTQNEMNFNEVQKVCLDNIQPIVEHIVPKRQKVARGNLLQNGRSKQRVSYEPAVENDNKENPDVENQHTIVENSFTEKENQPKRGRRRKLASVTKTGENLVVPKEDTSTGRFSFAQGKCLIDTHNEENSNETQKVVLDNTESSVELILPKRQKVARRNHCQRDRSNQVVSDEQPTEKDNKDSSDVVNRDNAVKEINPKRGRRRKVAVVPQKLEGDNFPLSSKDKSGAEEQAEALEMATAANKNPSCRGRCRNTFLTNSVPVGKKPRTVNNVNQEEMGIMLKDVTKENVPKRGRRKLPAYEASTETNIQQRATRSKPALVKGKKVSADSLFENQSKRSQRKNNVLPFQTPTSPALKRSIILPSVSDTNETASENQNVFVENNVSGKEKLAINGRRNKKIVSYATSVRKKSKLPEKDKSQEKQNVNMEKASVSNDKHSRRAMRKVSASETKVFEEICVFSESRDDIPKDQQVIISNTISGMEDTSQGRRKRVLKGKNLPKHSDQKNTLSHGNKNPSKRGRRKQVTTEPETHSSISGMKKFLFAENTTSTSDAENTGSTLQRGRRKKIKEHISTTTESAAESQTKMKTSRRTKKQVL